MLGLGLGFDPLFGVSTEPGVFFELPFLGGVFTEPGVFFDLPFDFGVETFPAEPG